VQGKYEKEFIKIIEQQRYKYSAYQLFYDFCECVACSINSPLENHEIREQRYQETIKRYQDESIVKVFGDMLGALILAIEENPFTDVLGDIYMQLEISDKKHLGQCFTPDHVSLLCSQLILGNIEEVIKENGFVTLNDCCVGGGSMVLSFAKAFKDLGFKPQKELCVVCNDIDSLCVNMTYIQLSLNGIPARVLRGDTITQKFTDYFHTPMWVLNGFNYKYERMMKGEESRVI
jgi:hypothetical protein